MALLREIDQTYQTLAHARHDGDAVLRIFNRFAEFAEGTPKQHAVLNLAFDNEADRQSFCVGTVYQSLRFSLDYEYTEGRLLGIVYVHKLPFHDFEVTQLVGSFTITSSGDTSFKVGEVVQRLTSGDHADRIILHYLAESLELKPILK